MKHGATLSSLLALSFVLTCAGGAAAAEVRFVQSESLPRLDASGAQVSKRPLTMHPEGVSARDCLDDQRIRVPLQLDGFEAQATLEGWASLGADCSAAVNRAASTALCWRVTEAIPLERAPVADVPVRRLIAGSLVPAPGGDDRDAARVCSSRDATPFWVHFLYFAPGQRATPAATAAMRVEVDTIGDPAPVDAKIFPGDTSVELQWAAAGNSPRAVRVNVYCAPTAPATGDFVCSTPGLFSGIAPAPAAATSLLCDSVVGTNATRSIVGSAANGQSLENDRAYGFALASVDDFGNVGPVSKSLCESPRAGAVLPSAANAGDSGASGCSASPAHTAGGSPGGSAAFASALAIGLALVIRTRVGVSSAPRSTGTGEGHDVKQHAPPPRRALPRRLHPRRATRRHPGRARTTEVRAPQPMVLPTHPPRQDFRAAAGAAVSPAQERPRRGPTRGTRATRRCVPGTRSGSPTATRISSVATSRAPSHPSRRRNSPSPRRSSRAPGAASSTPTARRSASGPRTKQLQTRLRDTVGGVAAHLR